jgi:hypothetical protein
MGAAVFTVRRSLSMRRKGKTMSGRFAFFRQNSTPGTALAPGQEADTGRKTPNFPVYFFQDSDQVTEQKVQIRYHIFKNTGQEPREPQKHIPSQTYKTQPKRNAETITTADPTSAGKETLPWN